MYESQWLLYLYVPVSVTPVPVCTSLLYNGLVFVGDACKFSDVFGVQWTGVTCNCRHVLTWLVYTSYS